MKKRGNIIIYANIADHINKRPYLIKSPQSYKTNIPLLYESGEIFPIYEENDMRSTGRSKTTIAEMIDMRFNNIPFEILDYDDIIDIKLHLDKYLDYLGEFKQNKEATEYLEKASKFSREITLSALKTIRNKKVRAKLKTPENIFMSILEKGEIPMTQEERKHVITVK